MHTNNHNIGVVGLGLIGGSIAKALKEYTDFKVLGYDKSDSVITSAMFCSAIDENLDGKLDECDIIIMALYPEDTVHFIKENAKAFKKNCIIVDTSGVKGYVCERLFPFAKENNIFFTGGHPMAGIERSGFEYSKPELFKNASFILTPPEDFPQEKISFLWSLLSKIGFSHLEVTTPDEHDRMIAFTSQLAHIVSSAYIMSPSSLSHFGFSAGSFKDMTRVAKLNENMWTELFLENKDCLSYEIDGLIKRLEEFNSAIKNKDKISLFNLLKKGREMKEETENLNK